MTHAIYNPGVDPRFPCVAGKTLRYTARLL